MATRRRRRTGTGVPHPVQLERKAERALLKLLRPIPAVIAALRAGRIPAALQDDTGALRVDVATDPLTQAVVAWLRGLITQSVAESIAQALIADVMRHSDDATGLWLDALSGKQRIGLAAQTATQSMVSTMASNRISAFASYITSLSQQMAQEVEEATALVVEEGLRSSALADALEQRLGVTRSRAKLIARDQVGKAQSAVIEARQRALGITRYEWRTAGDDRVRPSHRALEGQVFRWDAPPAVGHPGEDIQCRCIAIPIFDPIE